MTKKEKLLAYWKMEIRKAIKYREDFAMSEDWSRFYAMYRGHEKSSIYSVNKYFSMLRSMIPRIYFRNPKVFIAPRKPMFEPSAAVIQSADNYILKEIGIKETMKKVLQDTFFCNKGFVKVGYDREFGQLPALDEVGSKTLPEEEEIEYNVSVKEGMPWVLRTSPECVLVKWGTVDLTDVMWVAHKVVRPLEDVKKDPIYENTKELKGGYSRNIRGQEEGPTLTSSELVTSQDAKAQMDGSEDEWVEVYEIRDAKKGEILAINLEHDKFLRTPTKDKGQVEGVPFVELCFNPDNDVFWGPSDASLLEPLQREINDTKAQISMHRRINLIKFLFDEDLISNEQFQTLFKGNVGAALGIRGLKRDSIIALQPGEPLSLKQDVMELERDINETLGFPRTEEGEYAGPPRRTAAEIQQVSQGHWIRIDERRDLLADFLINVTRKINQIIFTEWTTEHITPVVGPDRAVYWVKYTGADIVGEYDYTINMDTGKPVTTEARREEAERLLDKVRADPNAMQYINAQYLWDAVFKLYDWIDPERISMGNKPPAQAVGMEQFRGMFGGRA